VHLVQPFDRPTAKAATAIEALCRETLAQLVASGHWRARLIDG